MNQVVLALPDPTNTSPDNCTASCVVTGHLIAALRGREELRTEDHASILREVQGEVWERNFLQAEKVLEDNLSGVPAQVTLHLRWVTNT